MLEFFHPKARIVVPSALRGSHGPGDLEAINLTLTFSTEQ